MTRSIGSELIDRLSAGVRPEAAGELSTHPGLGADVFSAALQRASAGDIRSDLPVTVARGVDAEIHPETLERLSALVDQAQAQGASRALVLTDDGMLELDVLRRRVESVVRPGDAEVLTGFDAVLIATSTGRFGDALSSDRDDGGSDGTPADHAAELTGPLRLPSGGFEASSHAALLDALGQNQLRAPR